MNDSRIHELIRDVPDFPEPGILFKDITPVLGDAAAFKEVITALAATIQGTGATSVVGIEARGFVLAAPVALELGIGFVPVRKAGKLPSDVEQASYELEYGKAVIEIHRDAVKQGEKVAVIDDVLATGGTARATCDLIDKLGASVVAVTFLIELEALAGRSKLEGRPLHSLLTL